MEIQFRDKVVLVTGATRGIGKQLAQDFERLGANLIVTGTRPRTVKNAEYHCTDFSDETSLLRFVNELKQHQKIDVCVNNAGINRIDYIYQTPMDDWDDIIDVNLKAAFAICREVSQIMIENGYGRIVNIASIFGVVSREKRAAYSSSKSGLIGLTRAVAIDLAPHNILVNSVSPGFVLTELTKKILTDAEMERLAERIPLGRFATPEDISNVVLFLASDLNTYISGQNIIVDGGYVIN